MTTTIERAGISFDFNVYDDSNEYGKALGFELEGFKLTDAAEFTAWTEKPPTPENVQAYVDEHTNAAGEEATEKYEQACLDNFDEPDDDDEPEYDGP